MVISNSSQTLGNSLDHLHFDCTHLDNHLDLGATPLRLKKNFRVGLDGTAEVCIIQCMNTNESLRKAHAIDALRFFSAHENEAKATAKAAFKPEVSTAQWFIDYASMMDLDHALINMAAH